MKKWVISIFLIVIVAIIGFVIWSYFVSNVEQPSYKIISDDESIEVREYPDLVVAEVFVEGKRKEAIKEGFRMLADYIFGNNQSDTKIPMTAPVMQEHVGQDKWLIRFVMPSKHDLENLPKVRNDKVMLKRLPASEYVTIRFSGMTTDSNMDQHAKKLDHYFKTAEIAKGDRVIYAFYNPPWTLPFLRRNEIWYSVDQK